MPAHLLRHPIPSFDRGIKCCSYIRQEECRLRCRSSYQREILLGRMKIRHATPPIRGKISTLRQG